MTTLSKRERVDAALRGEVLDRVPVAAWRHFIPEERDAETLAAASLSFFHTFDWDWLKVNPRATYYAEAWGHRYNFDIYNGVLPRLIESPFIVPPDLARLTPVSPTAGVFAEQLDLLRRIKVGIGEAHFVQTVFSPLSVLHFLLARPNDPVNDDSFALRTERLRALLRYFAPVAHSALAAIAETLAAYAAASVDAGASGIFFAIVRLAREGVLTPQEYADFGQPYDLRVLQAVQGAPFNLLHTCGPQVYFEQALDYPVHAINWAAVGQGNPTLAEARARTGKALIGGIDEDGVIQRGSPDDVIAEAQAALHGGEPGLLLTPGCGVAVDVPAANLHALRRAVAPVAV